MFLQKYEAKLLPVVEWLILLMALILSNRLTWLCMFEINKPLFSCQYGNPSDEFLAYLIILALVLFALTRNGFRSAFSSAWRQNWLLIVFLLFCLSSVFWTISIVLTVYKSLLVIVSAVIASYLGIRYRESDWLKIILWFSAISVVLSYILVWILPGAAIMTTYGLEGDWRGVFSHKNYMGAIIAYGASIIALSFFVYPQRRARIMMTVLFVLSVILIVLSRSATGLILFVLLLGLLFFCLALYKWGDVIKPVHYIGFAVIVLMIGLLIFANLNTIMGLLGRDTGLTGRVPLWVYLWDKTQRKNIWLGYGLGTIWYSEDFRVQAGNDLGWSFQVVNGHNGFVDILLYLGVVGLGLFILLVFQAIWRAVSSARKRISLYSFWTLLTLAYVILANLTISFFFQFETFHWVLLVVILFISTPLSEKAPIPKQSSSLSSLAG